MHGGNNNEAAAVYKNGSLIHASQNWTDLVQAASMEVYYRNVNDKELSINQTNSLHRFDSIPDGLEAFRKIQIGLMTRTWGICCCR
jgi:hypothetical protein